MLNHKYPYVENTELSQYFYEH